VDRRHATRHEGGACAPPGDPGSYTKIGSGSAGAGGSVAFAAERLAVTDQDATDWRWTEPPGRPSTFAIGTEASPARIAERDLDRLLERDIELDREGLTAVERPTRDRSVPSDRHGGPGIR